jgi:hypothetical protein
MLLGLLVLGLAAGQLSIGPAYVTAEPGGGQYRSTAAHAAGAILEPLEPGCLSGFVSSISASEFVGLSQSAGRQRLASIVMDVDNTCTGQEDNVIVATEIPPSALHVSSTGASVVADIPYRGTGVHLETTWVCTERMHRLEGEPGAIARFCPAAATGTVTFRGETLSFSAARAHISKIL